MPQWTAGFQWFACSFATACLWVVHVAGHTHGLSHTLTFACASAMTAVATFFCLLTTTRMRHTAEADGVGVSRRLFVRKKTVPWEQVSGYRVETSPEGVPSRCVVLDESGRDLLMLTLGTGKENEPFLAFLDANITARGRAELVAAGAPEGSGLEPEASSAPAGRGTEPEAVGAPAARNGARRPSVG